MTFIETDWFTMKKERWLTMLCYMNQIEGMKADRIPKQILRLDIVNGCREWRVIYIEEMPILAYFITPMSFTILP